MINRANKKLMDAFLDSKKGILDDKSIRVLRAQILSLLTFLDEIPLRDAQSKLRGYKAYLQSGHVRRDRRDGPLSFETVRKKLAVAREFLHWLSTHKHYHFDGEWLDKNLRLSRKEGNILQNRHRNARNAGVLLHEVERLARTPVTTLQEERTRAAAVFLFLTGMRANAFVTLPIRAVDLVRMQVHQRTELGVDTKLAKSATTPILDLQEFPVFLEIVKAWDAKVRAALPPDAMWFANISPITGTLDTSLKYGVHRAAGLRKDLHSFCTKAGLSYKNPHSFRHGAIGFLRDRAKNPRDLEAIKEFAMHDNLATTLRYGQLLPNEANEIIQRLCGHPVVSASVEQQDKRDESLLQRFSQLSEDTQRTILNLVDNLMFGKAGA